jgi:hypothetical protein
LDSLGYGRGGNGDFLTTSLQLKTKSGKKKHLGT